MRQRTTATVIALAVILVFYAALSPLLFRQAGIPFDSDEGIHALEGLQIAADLYHLDARSLFDHIYFTEWYPPLLPAYLGLWFVALGPSPWSARYAVLVLALVYLALIYAVSRGLARSRLAGLISLGLAATSPLVWSHSLPCMEEMLSMVAVLLTMWAYVRAESGKLRPGWVGAGMAITLLIRLSTGIYLAGAIALVTGLGWLAREKRRLGDVARMVAPFVVVCAVWWGHPAKIANLIEYVQASPPAYAALGWREASYYWRELVTVSTVSPLLGAVVLASIAGAAVAWRDRRRSLPLAVVMTTWVVLLVERQLNMRFFIGALSCGLILTGYSVTRLRSLLAARKPRWLAPAYVALGVAVAASALPFLIARVASFPLLMEVAFETDREAVMVYTWVDANVDHDEPIFFVNGWDQVSTPALNFYLGAAAWPRWRVPQVADVLLADPAKKPHRLEAFNAGLGAAPTSYVAHLSNSPVPEAGAWWAYQPALQACWNGDWISTTGYVIDVWDGNLEHDILRYPFRYDGQEERRYATEEDRYALAIEARIAECEPGAR